RDPRPDRRPDVHPAAGQRAVLDDRVEEPLALQQRDVEEWLAVELEEVDGDEDDRLVGFDGAGSFGFPEGLALTPAALVPEPEQLPAQRSGRRFVVHAGNGSEARVLRFGGQVAVEDRALRLERVGETLAHV